MNKILSKATELVGFSGFQQLFGLIAQKQKKSQTYFLDKSSLNGVKKDFKT